MDWSVIVPKSASASPSVPKESSSEAMLNVPNLVASVTVIHLPPTSDSIASADSCPTFWVKNSLSAFKKVTPSAVSSVLVAPFMVISASELDPSRVPEILSFMLSAPRLMSPAMETDVALLTVSVTLGKISLASGTVAGAGVVSAAWVVADPAACVGEGD